MIVDLVTILVSNTRLFDEYKSIGGVSFDIGYKLFIKTNIGIRVTKISASSVQFFLSTNQDSGGRVAY